MVSKAKEPKPERTVAKDENEGLASRLIELRKVVEDNRVANIKAIGEIKTDVGRMSDRLEGAIKKVDEAMATIDKAGRDLATSQRESAEQVRAAGELVRGMKDRLKVLDELRETAADPYELLKPIRKQVGEMVGDFEALKKNIDVKFESLPKVKPVPLETRGDDSEIQRLRIEVKRLAKLVEER
jgi:methyl-accepting chemotaxis protein